MAGTGPPLPDDPREAELAARGLELVRAAVADTSAPLALRERIERDRERARPAGRRRFLGLAGSFVAVAAAAAVALVVSLGGSSKPSVLATVRLAGAGPVLPAPARDAQNASILTTRIEGLPLPNWNQQFKWRASGARTDDLDGRKATTVYYTSPLGARAAYTILGGAAIPPPEDARTLRLRGHPYHLLTQDGRRVVVWDRAGHTCVMSAPMSVPEERLLDLAAWDDGGKV